MKFKNWLKLREIATNTWLTPELQSFKSTISLGNNTALPGVFSTSELPPTKREKTTAVIPSGRKKRKKRKKR